MYYTLRALHITLMLLSVSGFALRWAALRAEAAWVKARWVRVVPHLVDTTLLATGLWLASHWDAGAWQGWLGVKMAGLLTYIVTGALALRGARRQAGVPAFAGALLAVLWMVAVALSKSPLGPFSWW